MNEEGSGSVPEGSGHEEVDLLAEEFLSRRRQGERPTIEEYAGRRPDLAAEIRVVFPTLLLIEDLGKESAAPPSPAHVAGLPGQTGEAAADPAGGLQQVGEYRILREIGRGGMGIAGTSKALGRVVVWEAASGKKAKTFEHLFGLIGFDPSSRYLVVGAPLEYVFLRTSDWETARRLSRSPRLSDPGPIAFDRKGEVTAMAQTESRIWLVEVKSGRRIAELEAPDPRTLNGLALDAGFLAACTKSQRCHFWDLRGIERQLAAAGLPWELRCRGDGPTREPLHVDAVYAGSVLGLDEDLEDPRSPALLRKHRHALFRPTLESYADIDLALAAPRFLVAEVAAWKYFRGLLEPSTGHEWTAPGFDDAA